MCFGSDTGVPDVLGFALKSSGCSPVPPPLLPPTIPPPPLGGSILFGGCDGGLDVGAWSCGITGDI
jgi:hypothetical protein